GWRRHGSPAVAKRLQNPRGTRDIALRRYRTAGGELRIPTWSGGGAAGAAALEVPLHERFEVAVEHRVHVAGLVLGPQVLDHLVRLQHVAADLAAEPHPLLVAADLVELGLALGPLEVGDLGLEHGHGAGAVLGLAALDLAGHHDAGGDVGEPHRGRRLVDVLAAGARGPEHVH